METKNILLAILMVAVFATGFMIGRFSSVGATFTGNSNNPVTETASKNSVDDGAANAADADSGAASIEGNTTISTSNLTDSQKKMLSTLGIDAESITVTPEMAACAESSLGASRMNEIVNGATPSFTEGVKLVACYK